MSRFNQVGFIGTGVMGGSMARHLLDSGYSLHVHNRTRKKAESLIERGAEWCDTLEQVAAQCETIITIVGFPFDVEETYLGDQGLLQHAQPGTLFIDMTTSRPDLAVRIAERAEGIGCAAVDAPVSGGDIGARNASLSIMVGGSFPSYERALPYFKVMGKNIAHHGAAGSGQHCKMVNQIAIASCTVGVCEAMAYAKHAGLDPRKVIGNIESGAAGSWTLSNLAPRMLDGDFEPGFYVKHFIKDLKIAIESATRMQLDLPGLALAIQLYERLASRVGDDGGTQALYQLYAGSPSSESIVNKQASVK